MNPTAYWLLRPIIRSRVASLLLTGETSVLRFWFALCSFGCATAIFFDDNYAATHDYTLQLASIHVQGLLFLLHASAMMYGVMTRKYNSALLLLEGVLGVSLWMGFGMVEAIAKEAVGPLLIGGVVAFYLLLRYPTHYGVRDES